MNVSQRYAKRRCASHCRGLSRKRCATMHPTCKFAKGEKRRFCRRSRSRRLTP